MTLSRREATERCFPCLTASEIAVKRAYACPSGEPCGAPRAERTSDLKFYCIVIRIEKTKQEMLKSLDFIGFFGVLLVVVLV